MIRKRDTTLGRRPILIETVTGVVSSEDIGLKFNVTVNGRPIMARGNPGLPVFPRRGDRVVVQITPFDGIAIIIAVIDA